MTLQMVLDEIDRLSKQVDELGKKLDNLLDEVIYVIREFKLLVKEVYAPHESKCVLKGQARRES